MNNDIINKDFDDFLKKRYENHTIEPERALWEGINARLYQKKIDKSFRKVRHLKVAISSLAMVIVATFIYFEIKTDKYSSENQPISEIVKTTDSSDNSNENLLSVNNTQGKISDSINNISGFTSNLPIVTSGENKREKIKLINNQMRENKKFPSAQKNTSAFFEKSEQNSAIGKANVVDNKTNADINLSSSALALNMDTLKNHPSTLMIPGIRDSSIIIGTNIVNAFEKIVIPKDIEHGSLKLFKPITSILPLIIKPGIEKSVNLQMAGSTVITQVSQKQDKSDLKSPGLNQSLTQKGESGTTSSEVRHFPFFIEGFVSPEISYRALVANTKYSMPDYGKTYFNKREKADFTFSTGISGGFGITKNMILRSGIFYSTYSYKFKTEAIHLLNTLADGNLIYTSSGPVSLTFVSSDSLSNESLLKSSLNFSYLNIPLITELHFANNYFINLGLNFNMLVGQNMNWQAENYDGNFVDATAQPIKGLKSGSFSMIVGFGVEKHVSQKLSIIVNPSLKIYLSSINNTAPVKSYPYAWGLQTGLRYYFN